MKRTPSIPQAIRDKKVPPAQVEFDAESVDESLYTSTNEPGYSDPYSHSSQQQQRDLSSSKDQSSLLLLRWPTIIGRRNSSSNKRNVRNNDPSCKDPCRDPSASSVKTVQRKQQQHKQRSTLAIPPLARHVDDSVPQPTSSGGGDDVPVASRKKQLSVESSNNLTKQFIALLVAIVLLVAGITCIATICGSGHCSNNNSFRSDSRSPNNNNLNNNNDDDDDVWKQVGRSIDGSQAGDRSGTALALNADGTMVAIASEAAGNGAGHLRVFAFQASGWEQLGQALLGEALGDESGQAIALSDDGLVVAISSINNDNDNGNNAGHVRVYMYNDAIQLWFRRGSDIDGAQAGDRFGWSVSLNGDGSVLAVGSEFVSTNGNKSGQAKVYEWTDNEWSQKGQTLLGDSVGDEFGQSVALNLDGSVLAVGADESGNSRGHVQVYSFSSSNGSELWETMGTRIDGANDGDTFGFSIDISDDGTILAVGARLANPSGNARVFQYSDNDWQQLGQTLEGEGTGDRFGRSVGLSADGTVLVVSGNYTGTVQVFELDNDIWEQVGRNVDGTKNNKEFGIAVSMSKTGTVFAIGAWFSDNVKGLGAGSVRVYGTNS